MKALNCGDVITIKAGSKILFFGDAILNSGVFEIKEGVLAADILVFAGSNAVADKPKVVSIDAIKVYKGLCKK